MGSLPAADKSARETGARVEQTFATPLDAYTQAASAFAHVRFTREGWHHWPDAPPVRAYLRDTHRHIFHFEVAVSVGHDDREIEFHDLRDFCLSCVADGHDFGSMSCEGIARQLLADLAGEYGRQRRYLVSVFEDNENGAVLMLPAAQRKG